MLMCPLPTMQSLQSAAAREQLDSQQLQYAKVQQQQLQAARDTAVLLQRQVDLALTQVGQLLLAEPPPPPPPPPPKPSISVQVSRLLGL